MCPGIRQDLILGPEARRHHREAREGEPADQEGPEGARHLLAQAAHIVHILRVNAVVTGVQHTVLHPVDHRAGTEEQQRFEEGVGHQVEGGGHISADPQGGDHVAQLGDRRVSQHAFDIVLRHGDRGAQTGP